MILDKLADSARNRVERLKIEKPLEQVKAEALACDTATGFPFEKALAAAGISFTPVLSGFFSPGEFPTPHSSAG